MAAKSAKKISEKIGNWISAKVREANARGVVFGMSGGVDSSVTAVLAERALEGKALGLVMPCESDTKDLANARLVAEKFSIRTQYVDLTPVFQMLKKTLPDSDEKTLGNLKARLRMTTLYHFANKNNYLVLGTSNKSEIAIGYFTKYGDSGADILPLGDLYKTQVIELAKHLGIHDEIIKAAPTAGLWKGQTDEQEIWMDYPTLDSILEAAEMGRDAEAGRENILRVKELVKGSTHKRQMPEVCKI